jgi:hypothetical protein
MSPSGVVFLFETYEFVRCECRFCPFFAYYTAPVVRAVCIYRHIVYSTTPFIRINLDGEPSGYAENPDNWIFLKWAALAV